MSVDYKKEKILKTIKDENIKFIRLQFTDIFGTLKNVSITSSQIQKAMDNKCMFDGSSIEGFVRIEESDMYLKPDLDTFAIFPWAHKDKVARLICDIYTTEGKPFEGDPRYRLIKVLKEAEEMGYQFNVGPECEFFLLHTDEFGKPTTVTHDEAGYFDLGPIDMGENARRDMCIILEEMGFEVEASHHEVAYGQHEIDFKYGDALYAADNIMTFKLVVRTVAQAHGLHATFMPKPVYGIAGSGMHTNMSLSKNGINAFHDENDKIGLSSIAYNFIAGLLNHVKSFAAITNPVVNSYKRLVPGYEAPVYIAWSGCNRSPLIRVPSTRGEGTRIELRSPDPASNPYLVLALSLAAGLDGIKNGMAPCNAVDLNIYDMPECEREKNGIERLPESLEEAITEFKKSDFVRKVLGDHIYYRYIEAKEKEWDEYRKQVHPWEIAKYLMRI